MTTPPAGWSPGAAVSPETSGSASSGTATAETAIILPALTALLVVLLGVGAGGVNQLRANEAARAAAREIARGETSEAALETVHRIAGEEARLEVDHAGDWIGVSVQMRAFGSLGWIPDIWVSARADLPTENFRSAADVTAPGGDDPA